MRYALGDGTVFMQSSLVFPSNTATAHCLSTYPIKNLFDAMIWSTVRFQKDKGKLKKKKKSNILYIHING